MDVKAEEDWSLFELKWPTAKSMSTGGTCANPRQSERPFLKDVLL